jgi:uncharacterized protein (TIGR00290 family)
VALSWSGGKDSALALQELLADPDVEVVCLVTSVTRQYDRVSVHGVRRALLHEQARRTGLPLVEIMLDASCTNSDYETAFLSALDDVKRLDPSVSAVAFGDLFLEDVRAYRERLLSGTGLRPVFPVWGADTTLLARRMIDDGFTARLVCVDCTQLAASFAGRSYDASLLADLPPDVDPCGERGEFHTCVYAGPLFTRALPLIAGERVRRDERFEYCDVVITASGAWSAAARCCRRWRGRGVSWPAAHHPRRSGSRISVRLDLELRGYHPVVVARASPSHTLGKGPTPG